MEMVSSDKPNTSLQAPIAAEKRGTTDKVQPKPPPIVVECVNDVNLLLQGIKRVADVTKVQASASMGGIMRLYSADASTVSWLDDEQYE